MSANAAASEVAQQAPVVACTVARDLDAFEGLIAEMEACLGEGWGELTLEDAEPFLDDPEAAGLEFLAVAVGPEDEDRLDLVARLVAAARARGVAVILVAGEVRTTVLHALLKLGAHGFVPYPLPEGELAAAIARLPPPGSCGAEAPPKRRAPRGRAAVVLPVHGLAGGVGATTLAVNLAWELACLPEAPRVCLMDLDLQFGSVATYLDLPRREASVELLAEAPTADADGLTQALTTFRDRLRVLTAPPDMAPLDLLTPEGVERLLAVAGASFDYVVVDMPRTVTEWTGTLIEAAHLYFPVVQLDLRSAENALRMSRAVGAEELGVERLRWVLNRAPGRLAIAARSNLRRLAQSLDVKIELLMPDGGRAVAEAGDQGRPLGEAAPRNALRREVARLAGTLHADNRAAAAERGER
jgi:pilus assembly protein CpaE